MSWNAKTTILNIENYINLCNIHVCCRNRIKIKFKFLVISYLIDINPNILFRECIKFYLLFLCLFLYIYIPMPIKEAATTTVIAIGTAFSLINSCGDMD